MVQLPEGKVLFDGGIKSQPVDAVKSMIEFFDGKACERLPKKVMLADGWWLVLSSKKNEYYVTSAKECSCSGFVYRRRCKHVQALRDAEQKEEKLSPRQQLTRHIQQMEAEGVA